jgi:predicted nucleic acid-binding protein
VYAADSGSPARKQQAASDLIESLLTTGNGAISYQVVQEFLNVMVKRAAIPMVEFDVLEYMNHVFRPLLAVHSSVELFREALTIYKRHKLSWYDSLIMAAAVEAGCSVIYTEDMHHGAKIGGVRIENPFL